MIQSRGTETAGVNCYNNTKTTGVPLAPEEEERRRCILEWSLEAREEVLAAGVLPPPLRDVEPHGRQCYHYKRAERPLLWVKQTNIDTDTVPTFWFYHSRYTARTSRRAVATASNEPTKTHERLVREELALPFWFELCEPVCATMITCTKRVLWFCDRPLSAIDYCF
jgi:hypothetical protein